uniref:L-serine deaminase n=1 Tax=Electrophorus electricus TaxID=8005 RepID=A0A4W4G6V0_ELEEL
MTNLYCCFTVEYENPQISKYVEEIVLVTDEEIKSAVSTLYKAGLVVEPSGCAALAALVNGKIPDVTGKNVVVVLSGGNIDPTSTISIFKNQFFWGFFKDLVPKTYICLQNAILF